MMKKSKILLLSAALISIIVVSSMVYAIRQESQYHSYTKTIKSCDYNGKCVMKDLVVQCLGNDVIDIKVVGESLDVPEDYESGDKFVWCD